jgi:outer membrane protein assembly factor BamD (BamD/ComL family)
MRTAASFVLILALFSACRTRIDTVDQDLTADQYFQKAIEATDSNNYRLAMAYYQVFLEKYPDDVSRGLWASYEVAFLHHKMGNDDRAIELFDELIARYENAPEDNDWPQGPLILAAKVKGNILAEKPAKESPS